MKFDGRLFAGKLENEILDKVRNFVQKPRIVSILVGNDLASELYTKLKQKAAERLGIEFEVVRIDDEQLTANSLQQIIKEIGERIDVTGLMIQLPLPTELRGSTSKLLEAIPLDKDVDGLRWKESHIVPATVRAILSIIDEIDGGQFTNIWKLKFVVVGARGVVGEPLVVELEKRRVDVIEVEWDTENHDELIRQGDVVISCVGKVGIVTGEMVKAGAIVVDVGVSSDTVTQKIGGDMTKEVYQKASVSVEVPGGVGPVTIACLMENAVEMYATKL